MITTDCERSEANFKNKTQMNKYMKIRHVTLLVLLFIAIAGNTFGQRTYQNPVITGMNPDPSICRVGDDYYLVTSTFEYFPGVPVYHSKDLVNWKQIGHALDSKTNCPLGGAYSSGGNYAPAIRYNDGTFYVSCTNYGGKGSQGAFYVTATNPAGPWSDPVWVGNWNVDPSIMFANDSMYWVSPDNEGSFMVGTFDPVKKEFITPLQLIASGQGGSSPEGPHMYKINDYYYLMSAEGGTGYEHREVIQRSKSPYGPYEASPYNPVISNMKNPESPYHAIGHADLVQLPDSSWWLFSLGIRPKGGKFHHLGRETFLAPVKWTDDGWPIAGNNGVMMGEFTAPDLPEHVWKKEQVRDDFSSPKLGLQWNFIRNPYDSDWSLTEKPGYLRLNGSKVSLSEKDSPAFVGRRQTDFNMVASIQLSFTPVAENEEAGLVVRGNDINHFSLVITQRNGERVVLFRKYLQDKVESEEYEEISNSDVVLKISATELEYKFWAQPKGKKAMLLGTAATKDISTEKISGFIGAHIGMYASGNGSANTNPADFDWFDYEGKD
jgi:xylan 1,4-beta-xylosidase